VTSYATSVTLCLAVMGFVRVFRFSVRRDELRTEIDTIDQRASIRLSAAMIGLLRSFSVYTFDAAEPPGITMGHVLYQDDPPDQDAVVRLRGDLRETVASFSDVAIGSGQAVDLDQPDRLFECGWSWGVIKDAPTVETTEPVGAQPDGVAVDEPYLQFTVAAISAIEDLFSERTPILGILNEEHHRLS